MVVHHMQVLEWQSMLVFCLRIGGFNVRPPGILEVLDAWAMQDIVNYNKFSIMARINGKLTALAYVGDDLGIEWLDKNIVNEEVRTALETFVSELE